MVREPGECGLLWNRVLMSLESGPQRLAHQHTRASLCSDCGFVWLGPAKLLFDKLLRNTKFQPKK
ncbi:LOW QUALITY PROTEIN: hypothetical protein PanWU01x14_254280 [Parasponia andersonii]|uniref:Uncharacterized protein n=1 Tax=Parasponia andersonii TaxID=3476 RepID=A0A2P5BBE1_PARAD|nr:LOW QUALITY PROTEIN: hypothetical protein PanWU01x14_254280 [Parasponia andersonii]